MATPSISTSNGSDLDKLAGAVAEVRLDEELTRLAIEATTEGFWDWNIQTGAVRFSDSWLRSLGYERSEVAPHVSAWEQLLHPDDLPTTMAALDAHFHGETEIYETKNRIRMKSGRYRWNRDRGKVIAWTDDGKPQRMVGSDTDLTETVTAETVFHAAFEGAPHGMLLADGSGRITQVNPSLLTLFGYEADELLGRPLEMLIAPHARDSHRNLVEAYWLRPGKRAMQDGREVCGRRKDGAPVPVQINLSSCEAGDESFAIATVVDLSGREERDQFFELSSDMLCVARPDGYFERINSASTPASG